MTVGGEAVLPEHHPVEAPLGREAVDVGGEHLEAGEAARRRVALRDVVLEERWWLDAEAWLERFGCRRWSLGRATEANTWAARRGPERGRRRSGGC
jgi:hypothetical protein